MSNGASIMVRVIGVNYDSASMTEEFVHAWLNIEHVSQVVIVDNYSSDAEVERVKQLSDDPRVSVMLRPNDGYGAALNAALDLCLQSAGPDEMVIFGNVDVFPEKFRGISIPDDSIPMPIVREGSRNRNPFLTRIQKYFLFIYRLPLKTNSLYMLLGCSFIMRFLGRIPSSAWAVHGSVFAATASQLRRMSPIFSDAVFLYGEELFFARAVEVAGYRFRPVDWQFDHRGGASTQKHVGKFNKNFLKRWRNGMQGYFDSAT